MQCSSLKIVENHTFCSRNIPPTLSEPSVIHFLQNCLFTVLNHFIFFLKLLSVCHFLCSMKTFPCHSMTLIIKLPYSLTIIKILLKHNLWINSLNRTYTSPLQNPSTSAHALSSHMSLAFVQRS